MQGPAVVAHVVAPLPGLVPPDQAAARRDALPLPDVLLRVGPRPRPTPEFLAPTRSAGSGSNPRGTGCARLPPPAPPSRHRPARIAAGPAPTPCAGDRLGSLGPRPDARGHALLVVPLRVGITLAEGDARAPSSSRRRHRRPQPPPRDRRRRRRRPRRRPPPSGPSAGRRPAPRAPRAGHGSPRSGAAGSWRRCPAARSPSRCATAPASTAGIMRRMAKGTKVAMTRSAPPARTDGEARSVGPRARRCPTRRRPPPGSTSPR